MSDLIHELKVIFIDSCGLRLSPDEIDEDTPLFGKESPYDTDSLDAMSFMLEVKERYDVEIPDSAERSPNLTIRAIAQLLEELIPVTESKVG